MSNILVAYFSASGETARLAGTLADAVGGELYEIKPAQKYSTADLDWNDKRSKKYIEMKDKRQDRRLMALRLIFKRRMLSCSVSQSGGTRRPALFKPSWKAMIFQGKRLFHSVPPAEAD
mgnify:CR=1 FL=1